MPRTRPTSSSLFEILPANQPAMQFKTLFVAPLFVAAALAWPSAFPQVTPAPELAKRADPLGDASSALSEGLGDASSAISGGIGDASSAASGALSWGTSVVKDGITVV